MQYNKEARGYIALMSVIVLGALGSVIMISVMLQSVVTAKTDSSTQAGIQARILAMTCGEEALQIIVETGTSSRSSSLSVASGTCSYTISRPSSETIINATGLFASSTQRIMIRLATTSPFMVLSSWQDVSDF
jgi:hypothetical protein